MTDSEGTAVKSETFLEYLKELPWCKQGDSVLVAVHKGTPEVIEQMTDHEVKVFPGGMTVKMQKSVLSNFQTMHDEGQPLPVVLVWKEAGVEIWYRKIKPTEFPYDAWSDDVAAAYERERVHLPSESLGDKCPSVFQDILSKVNTCPSMMPDY